MNASLALTRFLLLAVLCLSSSPYAEGAETERTLREDPLPGPDRSATRIDQIERLHAQAESLIAVNDFRGALAKYWDAVLLEPDDEAAYSNMGHCYLILGDFGRAKDSFQSALAIDPANESARAGLRRIQDPDALPS